MSEESEPEIASECRAVLEAWLRYWNASGHSTGLRDRTEALIKRLPEPSYWTPTEDEQERMTQ